VTKFTYFILPYVDSNAGPSAYSNDPGTEDAGNIAPSDYGNNNDYYSTGVD